jgi:hypothetical protein
MRRTIFAAIKNVRVGSTTVRAQRTAGAITCATNRRAAVTLFARAGFVALPEPATNLFQFDGDFRLPVKIRTFAIRWAHADSPLAMPSDCMSEKRHASFIQMRRNTFSEMKQRMCGFGHGARVNPQGKHATCRLIHSNETRLYRSMESRHVRRHTNGMSG